ncbi:isochorismatase family protein [Isosphaeraceae bacterium EP7]
MTSFERLTHQHAALLIVDLQGKLLAKIPARDEVVGNAARLIDGAGLLEIPVVATEQYPQGLGPSVAAIADRVAHRLSKTNFHCGEVPELVLLIAERSLRHITLAGIEAHICVAQTALELMRLGLTVQVAADAVASRHQVDYEFALRRLERAGVVVSTTEAILFEWTESSRHPNFKAISALVKDRGAAANMEVSSQARD